MPGTGFRARLLQAFGPAMGPVALADGPALAFAMFSNADGMTERQAALATLAVLAIAVIVFGLVQAAT